MGTPASASLTERLRSIEAEIAAGRAEDALPRCQEIATRYPRALAVQRVLGEIYLALRKPREALAALDRALTGDPEDARACCARAIVHQMHGDQMAALAWYRRACDIRPEDATLRATYREMAAALGQPPYQAGRAGLARLYLRGDLFTHAIREWESLVAENADSTRLEAHVGLVETLWRAGRAADAEAWARRTLTNAPSCLKPLLIAGIVAHDEGRDADAEPFLRRAADLDPDHRAARALFSDRFGAGDTALGALLWGETPPFDASLSGAVAGAPWSRGAPEGVVGATGGQRITAPAARRVNRPLVDGAPSAGGAPSRVDLSAGPAAPLPPLVSHGSGDLPEGFHSMFKETEGMLWAAGQSDPDALAGGAAAGPPGPMSAAGAAAALAAAAPSLMPAPGGMEPVAPPPAIAESGFALGDTEMRRAIRWVQWLQAQGARALGEEPQRGHPSGSIESLLNAPPGSSTPTGVFPTAVSAPLLPPITSLPSSPSGALSSSGIVETQPPSIPPTSIPPPSLSSPSGPLPPPSSADLRQMFAELDPEAQAYDETGIVDADPAPPLAPVDTAPAGFASALGWDNEAAPAVPPAAPPDALEPLEVAPVAPTAPTAPTAPASANLFAGLDDLGAAAPPAAAGSAPDATIEELAREDAAGGFTPFELEPGALAALASGERAIDEPEPLAAPRMPEPILPEPALPEEPAARTPLPSEPALEPLAEPDIPEPVAAAPELSGPAGPDPRDFAARLEQARGHRDAGALDEAIVEYRTVVRNAPDLLPDVLADVEGALVERPEHSELHRLLGDTRIRQGDYIGAIESYNRATALQSLETPED